jgi:DNA-binding MarR family transcriptional regulator
MDTVPSVPAAAAADTLARSFEDLMGEYVRWLRAHAPAGGPSTSRLRLLESLHCEGAQKMNELAETLGVTPRNVTALVDGLEEEGMVRRTAHPTDRRVTLIELTDEAPDPTQMMAAHRAAIGQVFGCLTAEEQADYLAFTRRLEDRFRQARMRETTPAG